MSGSVQATDRLMKELRDIYRSPSFKGGECCQELHGGGFLLILWGTQWALELFYSAEGEDLWCLMGVALSRVNKTTLLSVPCHCWVEVRSMLWVGELSDFKGDDVPTPFLSPGTQRKKLLPSGLSWISTAFHGRTVPEGTCTAGPRGFEIWVMTQPPLSVPPAVTHLCSPCRILCS